MGIAGIRATYVHDNLDSTHGALHHGYHLCAWERVAAYFNRHATDIRRAMTDSGNIPPAARTIAVSCAREAGGVRMETVNVTVRMERQTRDDAAKLFSELGISTIQAISMFLKLPCPKERYRYYLSA